MDASPAPRPSGALESSGESVSALFHQLNNRLGVILGYCELLLLDTPATDARRQDLLGIKTAAHSAAALLLSHDPDSHDVSRPAISVGPIEPRRERGPKERADERQPAWREQSGGSSRTTSGGTQSTTPAPRAS